MNPTHVMALDMIDVRKLKKQCNATECEKSPGKRVMILEIVPTLKRIILDLYFCESHFEQHTDAIVEHLSAHATPGSYLEKKVVDIGFVTY